MHFINRSDEKGGGRECGKGFSHLVHTRCRGTQGRAPKADTRCTLGGYCSTHRDGVQWLTEARGGMCHKVPVAHNSVGTIAPIEQAPHHAHWHARTSAIFCNSAQLSGYCRTHRDGAQRRAETHRSMCHNALVVRSSAGTLASGKQAHSGMQGRAPTCAHRA